jgi:alkylation response protein AidB-like acyl-CoA dehydrogenase
VDFDLDHLQQEIRDTTRELLRTRSPLSLARAATDRGEPAESLWSEFVELGWPGILVAEEYGGAGLGCVELSVIAEQHGYALAPTPLLGTTLVAGAISSVGTAEQRKRVLPAILAGEAIAGLGTATEAGSELVLDGGGAAFAILVRREESRLLIDPAALDLVETIDGTRRFARTDGVGAEKLGSSDSALGDVARVVLAAELVGICQRALDLTVDYVRDRRQFGVPVGSFQSVANRCAAMLRFTEIARSAVYAAAWAAEADPAGLADAAAIAKAAASEAGCEVTGSAIQAHGGVGFTWEADLHLLFKRAQVDAQLFGGAGSHRRALGRRLLEV